jgi:hypothetical protein
MKTPVIISLTTVALVVVVALAFMNNACKSGHHS